MQTYYGPLRLDVNLAQIRRDEAQRLLNDPAELASVGDSAASQVAGGIIKLSIVSAVSAILGAGLLSALIYRRRRELLVTGGLCLALIVGTGGGAAATWNVKALTEPTYTGLLINAPSLVGDANEVVSNFNSYQRQLASFVTNLTRVYAVTSNLSPYQPDASTIRVLHVSDLHLNPRAFELIRTIASQFKINLVIDTGDITDFGSSTESGYVSQIKSIDAPYVFIRGNHDSVRTGQAVAAQPNATVLDGTKPVRIAGLTILGAPDPRFTPDKSTLDDDASSEQVQAAGRDLAEVVETMKDPPDVTLLHDPASAGPLEDEVPLILAGHKHERSVEELGSTTVLTEGSTGGAGLRGLQDEEPTPLECSVLYFERGTGVLQAYDNITLGGLGESDATMQRHVVATPDEDALPD